MLRLSLLLAVAVVASGCGGADSGGDGQSSGPETLLEISVWRAGTDGPVQTTALKCPSANEKCDRLAEVDDPFAPLPGGIACTQIYGGPQVAEVRGVYEGEAVDARFNRVNGCEIERWDRIAFLFPTR